MKKEKGITLVSLAVTIIVIIIISSITISVTFGENGIIKKAGLTKDLASNFIEEENGDMNRVMSEHANVMGGDGGISEPEEDTTPPIVSIQLGTITENSIQIMVTASDSGSGLAENDTYKYYINGESEPRETNTNNSYIFTGLTAETQYTIRVEAFDKAGNKGEGVTTAITKKKTIADIIGGDKVEDNTLIEDDLGNKVWIPGGFGVAEDSGTKVEDGIVIEDSNGNQFVWIPVGIYKVTNEISSAETLVNYLSRRIFTSNKATEIVEDNEIKIDSYSYYGEGDSRSIAYNTIGKFKTSATSKGGFYIGRYEQGTGNVCKKNMDAYVNVTRDQANTKAKSMYNGNQYVTSELVSSYAWDTVINFICQTNPKDSDGVALGYKLSITTDNKYGNIGGYEAKTGTYKVNGKESDKYSNIYDILGNCFEWTTGYTSHRYGPCVIRGRNMGS